MELFYNDSLLRHNLIFVRAHNKEVINIDTKQHRLTGVDENGVVKFRDLLAIGFEERAKLIVPLSRGLL